MKTTQIPTMEQLPEASRVMLEQVKAKLGKVPNLYATIGYSAAALRGMFAFDEALSQHTAFDAKEREAINLIVSQVNTCDYCLAAHTALAKMRGFTEADTIAIRKAEYPDKRLNTVIKLSQSIAANKGTADADLLEAFYKEGYNEAALMELIGLISLRTFTNYVFSNTHIPIDFPAAPSLGYFENCAIV